MLLGSVGSPTLAAVQFPPEFVLLKTPLVVPVYTVLVVTGLTAKLYEITPAGPFVTHLNMQGVGLGIGVGVGVGGGVAVGAGVDVGTGVGVGVAVDAVTVVFTVAVLFVGLGSIESVVTVAAFGMIPGPGSVLPPSGKKMKQGQFYAPSF